MVEKRTIEFLFPTPFFRTNIGDMEFVDSMADSLVKLRTDGIGSEYDPFGNFWQSHDNLHELPEFSKFVEIINEELTLIFDDIGIVRDSFYINNMWGNIAYPGHSHAQHMHPNSFWSGLIYLRTPPDSADTIFHDPRGVAPYFFEMPYNCFNELNSSRRIVKAEKGKMIFWPSWLQHSVVSDEIYTGSKHKEQGHRISIAFTVMFRGKVNIHTRKYEWK